MAAVEAMRLKMRPTKDIAQVIAKARKEHYTTKSGTDASEDTENVFGTTAHDFQRSVVVTALKALLRTRNLFPIARSQQAQGRNRHPVVSRDNVEKVYARQSNQQDPSSSTKVPGTTKITNTDTTDHKDKADDDKEQYPESTILYEGMETSSTTQIYLKGQSPTTSAADIELQQKCQDANCLKLDWVDND